MSTKLATSRRSSSRFLPLLAGIACALSVSLLAATTVLQDNFAGVNGTRLNVHTMNVGTGWTELTGTWTLNGSGKAKEAGGVANVMASADGGVVNYITMTASIDVPAGTLWAPGLMVRVVDANNAFVIAVERDGTGNGYVGIIERNANVNTTRASTNLLANPANTTVTLTVVTDGANKITATMGTGETTNYTSTTFNTATKFGLFNFGASAYAVGQFASFLVTSSPPAASGICLSRMLLGVGC